MAKVVWCQKWGARAQHDALWVKVTPPCDEPPSYWGCRWQSQLSEEVAVLGTLLGKSSPGCPCLLLPFLEPPRLFCDLPLLRLPDRSSKCNVGCTHGTELQEQGWYLSYWDFTEIFNSFCCSFHSALSDLHRLWKINYWNVILERRLKSQGLQAGSDNPA